MNARAEAAGRAFRALGRAARAGRLYQENNEALHRINDELQDSFRVALELEEEMSVAIEPDCFTLDKQEVLQETDRNSSIPFTFYRDGIRRLTFRRGLSADELDALVEATRQGLFSSGFGEDIASLLWRLDLDHVHYVVVDTSIVQDRGDANPGAPMAAQIDALMESLFGGEDITGLRMSLHLDEADLPAKIIADTLDRVQDMAPGVVPASTAHRAHYQAALEQEIAEEGDDAVTLRGLEGALSALEVPLGAAMSRSLGTSLLDLLDVALLEPQWDLAARLLRGVRGSKWGPEWVAEWMAAAASDTRCRHLAAAFRSNPSVEAGAQLVDYLRATGSWGVESMLAIISGIPQPELRREISNLALEFGPPRIETIQAALAGGNDAAIVEAVYVLTQLDGAEGRAGRAELLSHERAKVRAALADLAHHLDEGEARSAIRELTEDSDPEVRLALLRALVRRRDPFSEQVATQLASREALIGRAAAVKRAQLAAFGRLAQERAIVPLARYLKDGQRRLSGEEAGDLAVGAVWGLAQVRSVSAVEHVRGACQSKNRRVADAARRALAYMKERL